MNDSDSPRNHTEQRALTFQWDEDGKCTLANRGIEDFSADELRELCRFLDTLRGFDPEQLNAQIDKDRGSAGMAPIQPQTEAERDAIRGFIETNSPKRLATQ